MARVLFLAVAVFISAAVIGSAQEPSPAVPKATAQLKPAQPSGPVTIMFSITVEEGKEQEATEMFGRLKTSTRAEDEGVITYVFLQQQNSPREYVLYEQWRDSTTLNAHLARLRKVFGPARERG
jgi:quinol monooxygenase YgiN